MLNLELGGTSCSWATAVNLHQEVARHTLPRSMQVPATLLGALAVSVFRCGANRSDAAAREVDAAPPIVRGGDADISWHVRLVSEEIVRCAESIIFIM